MFTSFRVTGCSLELLRAGEQGIVAFCKSQDKKVLKKLISIGVTPGTTITWEKSFPDLVFKVGNRLLTIDRESIRAIYVHIIDNCS